MSGTCSSERSSTSLLGSFSSRYPDFASISRWSPGFSDIVRRGSAMTPTFLVGAQRDQCALWIELLLEDDDVALHLVPGSLHDVEAVVQDELLPGPDVPRFDGRVQVDLRLPALKQHVHSAVVIAGEVDPVRGGRRRELLDFLLQQSHLLARLGQRGDQLRVEHHDLDILDLDVTLDDLVDGLHGIPSVFGSSLSGLSTARAAARVPLP